VPGPASYKLKRPFGSERGFYYSKKIATVKSENTNPGPDAYMSQTFMRSTIGFKIGEGKRTNITKLTKNASLDTPGPGKYVV